MAPGPSTLILKSYFSYSELCFATIVDSIKAPVRYCPVPSRNSLFRLQRSPKKISTFRFAAGRDSVPPQSERPGRGLENSVFILKNSGFYFADGEIIRSTRNRFFSFSTDLKNKSGK